MRGVQGTGCTLSVRDWLKRQGAKKTHCYVGPEELVVPEKCAHVLHAAFLLHAVTDVGLEPGAKLNTHTHKQRHASEILLHQHEEKHIYFCLGLQQTLLPLYTCIDFFYLVSGH